MELVWFGHVSLRSFTKWSMGGCAWHLMLPVSSVACSTLEPLAHSLMLPSSSIVASWWRRLCLFLPALASSSAPKTVAPGDASPPLLGADRSRAALVLMAWWVPMPHRSSAAPLGALVNAWRGHKDVPLCVRLMVVHASVPLGSRQDLLHPPSSSWHGSVHTIQATCLPDDPVGVPRAHNVGCTAAAELGGRSRSVVVEPFLSQMVSCWDPVGRS
jgi:hypothetical protein